MSAPTPAPAASGPDAPGSRIANSLLWMWLSGGLMGLAQVPLLATLARLISPADFGLATAALVVLMVAGLFAEAGVRTALVQRPVLTGEHVAAGFGAVLVLSVLVSGSLAWAAPAVADLLGLPEAAGPIRVLSIVVLIENLTVAPALLDRDLQFRTVALIEITAFLVGHAAVAVVLALRGWGVWALVGGRIGQAVVTTVGHWIARPHTLRPTLARRPLSELFQVGSGELLAGLLESFATQADSVVVGRFLGATSLGLYGRAYRLMELPTTLFTQAIRKVMFPAMSTFQQDRARLGRAYLTGVGVLTAVTLPVCLVLALVADELVLALLGPDWDGLVPVFQVLVLAMPFRASPSLSDSLILACGAVYRQAGRVAFFAVLVATGALVGQTWGLVGVAVGVLAAMAGNYLAMVFLSLQLTGVGWRPFWRAQVPGAILAVAVFASTAPAVVLLRRQGAAALLVVVGAAVTAAATEFVLVRCAPHVPGLRRLARLVEQVVEHAPARLRRPLGQVLGISASA